MMRKKLAVKRLTLLCLGGLVLFQLGQLTGRWRAATPAAGSTPHSILAQHSTSGLPGSSLISDSSSSSAAACAAQEVLARCPGLPSYCPRRGPVKTAADYLRPEGPGDSVMAQQKVLVDQFLAGPGFKERLRKLQQLPDKRGILISAGKSHHVGNAAVVLHVLRHQHKCKLPVEIAYRGDKEIDPVTRATLTKAFAPLFWLDLEQQQYPDHHYKQYTMDRYEPKIYALYHTRFQQVLLLDADNMPVREPSYLFDSPHVQLHGAMFWLDLWAPPLSSTTFIGHNSVFKLLGINKEPYLELLSSGQGWMQRVAESGQVVLDRARHADVLEYLWWMTSFSSVLYKHVLGDKDTFGFAFALAKKLHEVYAVAVPPGAAFKLEDRHWHFHAMLQYDHLGQLTFFHRTLEKWNDVLQPPTLMSHVSGPLPNSFIISYMGNKTISLSPDIPHRAMRPLRINCPYPEAHYVQGPLATSSGGQATGSAGYAAGAIAAAGTLAGCPLSLYLEYQQAQEFGLPVNRQPMLEAACRPVMQQLGQLWAGAGQNGQQQQQLNTGGAVRALRSRLTADTAVVTPVSEGDHLRSLLAGSSSVGGTSSVGSSDRANCGGRSNAEGMWGQLDQQAWLQGCMRHRSMLSNSIGAAGGSSTQQQQQQQQAGGGVGAAAAAGSGVTASAVSNTQQLQQALPDCNAVEWGVARYAMQEYAAAVAIDSAGRPVSDKEPGLPLLQLAVTGPSPEPLAAAAGGGGGSSSQGAVGAAAGGALLQPCGLLQGTVVSPLDLLQLQAIPAARAWVVENVGQLPAVKPPK